MVEYSFQSEKAHRLSLAFTNYVLIGNQLIYFSLFKQTGYISAVTQVTVLFVLIPQQRFYFHFDCSLKALI